MLSSHFISFKVYVKKLETKYFVRIFPLLKKDFLIEKTEEVCKILEKNDIDYFYDESGTIGKRYARSDEIGIPYCLCVDFESCNKAEKNNRENSFTIRKIEDTKQEVVKLNRLVEFIKK